MSNIKVSVIVPVYNVEPYLSTCLDSLVNQTLRDIEIICINDCSPDKSLAILEEYATKDDRIKIINFEKNQGVSIARNSGMRIAIGEYIGFCDPDDYVDLDYYGKLYKLAKGKNADIAKVARKRMEIGKNMEFIENISEQPIIYKNYFKYQFTYQFTTAIYRNKMLKKYRVTFPVRIIIAEDVCFATNVAAVAKNVYALDNTFYHYIRRDDSVHSVTYNFEKISSALKAYCLSLDNLNKAAHKDKHYLYIYALLFRWLLNLLARNSEEGIIKKIAKIAIAYYKKNNSFRGQNLPRVIVASIESKDEKKLTFLLQKWVHYEFYPFIDIKGSILQNRKLYVWGIGEDGIRVKKQCESNDWKISGFLDSNKNTNKYNKYKVERPEQILRKPKGAFFIIISSRKYGKEIAEICREAGLKRGRDFWSPK
jgi:glycosyltransferase involved in cell wall biosynthesis